MIFKQELLGKYVKVIGGFSFKSEHYSEEGVPIVRISDIQGGTVSVDKVVRIPEAFIGKGERYAIEPGDVLITMSGATTGKIGLVPQNINGLILQNQRVGNFKVTASEKIHKTYLKHIVCSTAYQRQILSTMAGAAQPNISSKQLENIKIQYLLSPSNFVSPPFWTKRMRSEPNVGKPWRNWIASRSPFSLRCLVTLSIIP